MMEIYVVDIFEVFEELGKVIVVCLCNEFGYEIWRSGNKGVF